MKNRKIYAFDFDGTIVTNEFPMIGKPIKEVIDLIIQVHSQGHYIILNTMREGELLSDAIKFCMNNGIYFDEVNDNLFHMREFYKNNPRKIFANHYIDDHNMGVNAINKDYAELEQQLQLKEKALEKAYEESEKYKLALFMVVRNSKVMPEGGIVGRTLKEINQMSVKICKELLTLIDFDKARKEYGE